MVQSFGSNNSATSDSIRTGSSESVQPKRLASRPKWVSTVMPGMPKALPSTTLAVFRPTPGSVTRSSSRPGTSPSYSSTSRLHSAIRFLALARKNPVGLMMASSSAGSASAMLRASG